ncbi:MAG: aminotransferase class I/II-fold pyridoxal phosphate-dependent enzyme [Desulfobacteraceae bacterium]|nr:aminotransferase class I/II-fold pyridoxal phosphate-dependent enzyme [Desulfobacteraceae bacterium]MCF8094824.1 aminotransferase class I/II-fold pyridoxal phosphate-dependent enzyme [Desulfobacteraceae bacterium]
MNPIAEQLNETISRGNPSLMEMLSDVGKNLFFPKGILSQSAEAREKATRLNATIGIAKQEGGAMVLPSVMSCVSGLAPEESVTYAPSFGIPELRRKWQESLYEKNPSLAGKAVSLPVATNGITHAISTFADIWTDPDDVVIMPDMMWGNYSMIFNVRKKVRLSHYPMFTANGAYNVEGLAACLEKEAKNNQKVILLLNFPHNPTGYTVTETEADRIVKIVTDVAENGTNVIVVCDDAYFGLFYEEGVLGESIFTRLCESHPRLLAVKLDGATKENYVWGLRVGFLTYGTVVQGDAAPVYDALERKTAGCVRGNISNASHLSQSIVLRSMKDENYQAEKNEKYEVLKSRAQTVKSVLSDPKYASAWDVYPFNSGYFMCIRLKSVNAEKLRVHLLDNYGVGLISLGEHDLRVAFSCIEESEIRTLFDIVYQGVQDLS